MDRGLSSARRATGAAFARGRGLDFENVKEVDVAYSLRDQLQQARRDAIDKVTRDMVNRDIDAALRDECGGCGQDNKTDHRLAEAGKRWNIDPVTLERIDGHGVRMGVDIYGNKVEHKPTNNTQLVFSGHPRRKNDDDVIDVKAEDIPQLKSGLLDDSVDDYERKQKQPWWKRMGK